MLNLIVGRDDIALAVGELGLCLVLLYGFAIGVWLLSRTEFRWLWPLALGLFFLPLVIDARSTALRALAGVLTVDVFFKLIDVNRLDLRQRRSPNTLHEFLVFLVPFPVLNIVYENRAERERPFETGMRAILCGATGFALLTWLLISVHNWDVLKGSFVLDHTLKFVMLPVAWQCLATLLYGAEKFLGYKTRPLARNPILAASIPDFWARFNVRVSHWLLSNIYLPTRNVMGPNAGVMATFLFSGFFHELSCAVATSRVTGYQFLFFTLQAPAILAARSYSARFNNQQATGRILARLLTVAWFWWTSMLFLHAVDLVFPCFYAAEPWLP